MRLDTYSCWPDCFSNTPPCLWLDKIDGTTRTWSFGLDDTQQCHYQSLTHDEKQLVDSIWMSLPALIKHATEKEGDGRHAQSLHVWRDIVDAQDQGIRSSRYARRGEQIVVNQTLARSKSAASVVSAPDVLIENLTQLGKQLQIRDLDIFDLLLPGVDTSVFPGLSVTMQQAFVQQLNAYSNHPISQLY